MSSGPPRSEIHHTAITAFSLFEGDLLNQAFSRIGLKSRRVFHIAGRCLLVIVVTYVPMAALAKLQGLSSYVLDGRNFFADYAAYAQFLIALPLYIIGERIVSRATRDAANDFVETGVVSVEERPLVDDAHREVERLRLWRVPEYVGIALAFTFALWTFIPELFTTAGMETWHTGSGRVPRVQVWTLFGMTAPGLWGTFVALPVYNYWWLRLSWKVLIWTRYLYRVSRLRLILVASHPDLTGGIGFISEVQARFAVFIFAYGISSIAAVVAYKVSIEHAPLSLTPIWASTLGFVIGAPALFTLPLLVFTKQLFRTKRRAVNQYREHVLKRSIAFEQQWLSGEGMASREEEIALLLTMNNVATTFERVEKMRVVPFDLRSGAQLLGSTLGSVATALPLLQIEGQAKTWIELISMLLGHGGGG